MTLQGTVVRSYLLRMVLLLDVLHFGVAIPCPLKIFISDCSLAINCTLYEVGTTNKCLPSSSLNRNGSFGGEEGLIVHGNVRYFKCASCITTCCQRHLLDIILTVHVCFGAKIMPCILYSLLTWTDWALIILKPHGTGNNWANLSIRISISKININKGIDIGWQIGDGVLYRAEIVSTSIVFVKSSVEDIYLGSDHVVLSGHWSIHADIWNVCKC